eukprot:TRINITY_DN3931_c0_g1_i1.p1 TRINITY_DN3931_c0_g1~~TRINITY_DN3931_c0_g1_i1.p1  ORF type:complete len:617 (+),score=176.14 TRINITY_DN3931_c0_g1_i1:220-2070(+)
MRQRTPATTPTSATPPPAVLRPRPALRPATLQRQPQQSSDDDVAVQKAAVDSVLQKQRQRLRALGGGLGQRPSLPRPSMQPTPPSPPLVVKAVNPGGARGRAGLSPRFLPHQLPLVSPAAESPEHDQRSVATSVSATSPPPKTPTPLLPRPGYARRLGRRGSAAGDRMRVCVRKRPPRGGSEDCIDVEEERGAVTVNVVRNRIDLTKYTEGHEFGFDSVFDLGAKNFEVYRRTAQPLIDTCLRGGHATVFAYGQTGSGKTHTMLGGDTDDGLYMLTMREVFDRLSPDQSVLTSFYEIYCNAVYDLLNSRAPLTLREDAYGKVNIVGLTEHDVGDAVALAELMSRGDQERASGATAANDFSSRSHAVLQLVVGYPDQPGAGTLKFIDLAGSERGADTGEVNRKTQQEGAEINKSLLALKECIRGLGRGDPHIKFRGSKLTEVLRDSFVGDCRTCMIATVSPNQADSEHTLNTLRYAHRVRGLRKRKLSAARRRRPPPPRIIQQPVIPEHLRAAADAQQRRCMSAAGGAGAGRLSAAGELDRLRREVTKLQVQLRTDEERHKRELEELQEALRQCTCGLQQHKQDAEPATPDDYRDYEVDGGYEQDRPADDSDSTGPR